MSWPGRAGLEMASRPSNAPLRRIAWGAWGLSLLLTALGAVIYVATRHISIGPGWGPRGFFSLFAPTLSTVGALILARHPRHAIGWLFGAAGLASAVQFFGEEYAVYALLAAPGRLPGGVFMAWLQNWIWVPAAVPLVLILPLLFPDGRLVSPRWRPVAWFAGGMIVIMAVAAAVQPGRMDNFYPVVNPLGAPLGLAAWELLFNSIYGLGVATAFVAVLSLVQRLRRSQSVERQQLKWIGYASVLVAAGTVMGGFVPGIGAWVMIASLLVLQAAVAVAILRYRLYDIDLIIRRTLVYSVLTALLALTYFGSVVALQSLLRGVIGGDSQVAIVLSTLLIAALFVPLRSRVQRAIDRRFYRRKYDAARTLADFAASARDETDLERLSGQLRGVVDETMQPASVGLWLKESGR